MIRGITSWIVNPNATTLTMGISPAVAGDTLAVFTPAGMTQATAGTIVSGGITLLTYSYTTPTLTLTPAAVTTSGQLQTLLKNITFSTLGSSNISLRRPTLTAAQLTSYHVIGALSSTLNSSTTYIVSASSAAAMAANVTLTAYRWSGSTLSIQVTTPVTGHSLLWSSSQGLNFVAGTISSGEIPLGTYTSAATTLTATLSSNSSNGVLSNLANSAYFQNTTLTTTEGVRSVTYFYTYLDGITGFLTVSITLYVALSLTPLVTTTIDYILNAAPVTIDSGMSAWIANPNATTLTLVESSPVAGDILAIQTPARMTQATPETFIRCYHPAHLHLEWNYSDPIANGFYHQ